MKAKASVFFQSLAYLCEEVDDKDDAHCDIGSVKCKALVLHGEVLNEGMSEFLQRNHYGNGMRT